MIANDLRDFEKVRVVVLKVKRHGSVFSVIGQALFAGERLRDNFSIESRLADHLSVGSVAQFLVLVSVAKDVCVFM
ncbi:hypothetical protein D3C87_2085860 [compost metagenome]